MDSRDTAAINQSINQTMDRISNALTAIKDAGSSGASSVGGFFSSSADSGVAAFKSSSLGESFFKNVGAIMITVLILLGGIIYIDLVSNPTAAGVGSSSPNTTTDVVQRTVHIEPNTGLDNAERVIPKDDGWTAPILSIRNELKEAFGCLLYTSPSPRDRQKSRMPSSA